MATNKFRNIGRAAGMACMAAWLGGCVIATDSRPRAPAPVSAPVSALDAAGPAFCEKTATQVACGGRAALCDTSGDGRQVACGGAAPLCLTSRDGQQVACGGQAPFCAKSADGRRVACGGQAPFCERSGDGQAIACGGNAGGRQGA